VTGECTRRLDEIGVPANNVCPLEPTEDREVAADPISGDRE
jgi:hypothetical protein